MKQIYMIIKSMSVNEHPQRLGRANSGDYTCLASNPIGRGASAPLTLDIKCEPTLQYTLDTTHYALLTGRSKL